MRKEEYDKIEGLPDYEEMDREFEIGKIEEKNHPLKEIRRKAINKIDNIIEFLESILHPDPGRVIDVYECRAFNEKERQEIFTLCKELVILHRLSAEAEIRSEEEADKQAIKEIYNKWKEQKTKIIEIMMKLKEHWKKDSIANEILEYFG
jgi:hypothetical protein